MILLTPIEQKDIIDIYKWPHYTGDHAQMDYAIRENGWLDSYCCTPINYCYVAKSNKLSVGFSILIKNGNCKAEFRIAVHPHFFGSGYGKQIIDKTLKIAFMKHNFTTINLIVRKNNPIAQDIYLGKGFILYGERKENIQGSCIDFYEMELPREKFIDGERQCPML